MKSNILFAFFCLLCIACEAQIVPSSCDAPDSIKAIYQEDADVLAVERFYLDSLTYMDSIDFPKAFSDTMLNALIAIYNATGISERDTVVEVYNIHVDPNVRINRFRIIADSTLDWMESFKNGVYPTGNLYIDSIFDRHTLDTFAYSTFHYFLGDENHNVEFYTNFTYNIFPLTKLIVGLAGVAGSSPSNVNAEGHLEYFDISAHVNTQYTEVLYSKGLGNDCEAGCAHRYWKFRVYHADCSVEFIHSYFSWNPPNSTSSLALPRINISPNPFSDLITIKGIKNDAIYSIYDLKGSIIDTGVLSNNTINTTNLLSGVYFLVLSKSGIKLKPLKMIKN